jgi:methylated-DNA-protein-cysteine methyltransferase-like protein
MANVPDDVPWQRVVGVRGTLPIGKKAPEFAVRQRQLLENEGVEFMENGRIDMVQFGLLPSE